jgi:predicted ABC-type ATPase
MVQTARRPRIFVLAGVNGAGKSSVGGAMLADFGLIWFNPDTFSRELMATTSITKAEADADAWTHGKTRLEAAIAGLANFAFETTLGGNTIRHLLGEAARTHDIIMIYWGLASAEMHMARVRQRVASGGHDIPIAKIKERWINSRNNLVRLLPRLAHLQVFDNSAEAPIGQDVPSPILVLEVKHGQILYPERNDVAALASTPGWAKPIVAAAFRHEGDSHESSSGA